MCGIAGAVSLDTPPEDVVRAMVSTLRRRGPDGVGIWAADGAALGHSRLAVIDLTAAGAQPMLSASRRYVIVFNGEIYNAAGMRAQLDREGAEIPWRGHSDTEVLLEFIARHGIPAALAASAGMFAFAVWDRMERRLTLARDRAGEKPLYYGWAGDALIFASELKALRAHARFDPAIDPQAEQAFGARGNVPAPLTIYRDARKLPPGAWLTWSSAEGRVWPRVQHYWSMEEMASKAAKEPIADPDAADVALERALVQAVQRQMIADVPLGAFLSGGLDSSLIVAVMQAQSARRIQTFTVAFDEAKLDESVHAAAVARYLNTEHHTLRVSGREAQDVVHDLPEMFDEPFADASQIPTSLIAQLARRHVTVALSGDGGDELFGGYNRHLLLPRIHHAVGAWPPYVRNKLAAVLHRAPRVWLERLAGASGASVSVVRRLEDVASLLAVADDPAAMYAATLDVWPAIKPARQSEAPAERENLSAQIMLWDFKSYLPDDVLTKVDRAAMFHSLETRCPFLDPEVMYAAQRMSMSLKVSDGVGKRALRRRLKAYLPASVTERPKAGFEPPVGEWIKGPLLDWAEALLQPASLQGQSVFDVSAVAQLWRAHRSGKGDYGRKLWPVLMYNAWREKAKA